jgi:F-type H+-transporting ATPase subunit b
MKVSDVQLNWSTFIFEAINFLVLVWLLKRLLYTPVLNAISERRKAVEKTLAEAEKLRAEAAQLQKSYERRLQDWEKEKETKLVQLQRALDEERTQAMAVLENDLAKERDKQKVLEDRRLADLARRQEEESLKLAGRFCSRLLARFAGPELEARILDAFVKEVGRLPEERVQELNNGFKNHTQPVVDIKTAFALEQSQKEALSGVMANLLGRAVSCQFSEDSALVAGLRVTAGPLILQGNLRDELGLFLGGDGHE